MKKLLISSIMTIIMFAVSVEIYSQEHHSILKAPENWQSELIDFPISFAPAIELTGIEDLRFSPGWSDTTSQEFWTYMFVWYVDFTTPLSEDKLSTYFDLYYDGLMGVDNNNQSDSINSNPLDKTISLFVQTTEGFTGKLRVYDRFFTKDYMMLNVKVTESFCPKIKKQIILCEISPKDLSHDVWKIFENIQFTGICE